MNKPVIDTSRTRSGCNCWSIGCAGVFLFIVVGMCGGFYGLLYTGLPLTLLERALEEDGKIEIEGLTGNVSSGIEMEQLKFVDDNGYWSELKGIKFKYNGLFNAIRTNRFIIDELSVDEGTIYAAFSKNQELDFDIDAQEVDIENEQSVRGEFQLGVIDVAKLRIVNPETKAEINLEKVRYEGLHTRGNKVLDLGTLTVESSDVDIQTGPSKKFEGKMASRRLFGSVKSSINESLIGDIPFDIDFSLTTTNELRYSTTLLDGQIQVSRSDATSGQYAFDELTPTEIIKWDGSIQASRIHMSGSWSMKNKKSYKCKYTIEPGGFFYVGRTRFDITSSEFTVDRTAAGTYPVVEGVATVGDKTIDANVTIHDKQPFTTIVLRSKIAPEPAVVWNPELWSQVVFEKSYSDLDDLQRASIDASKTN